MTVELIDAMQYDAVPCRCYYAFYTTRNAQDDVPPLKGIPPAVSCSMPVSVSASACPVPSDESRSV